MNPTNDERARFEAWFRSRYPHSSLAIQIDGSGEYAWSTAEVAWAAWQAARSQSAPSQREVDRLLDEAGDRGLDPPVLAAQGEAVAWMAIGLDATHRATFYNEIHADQHCRALALGGVPGMRVVPLYTTPQPSADHSLDAGNMVEPNAAWVHALESYTAAARVIALYLKQFCDESRPYPEMIAHAARKAAAEIERLGAQPSADDAPHQALTLSLLSEHARIAGGYISPQGAYVVDWDADSKHQLSIGVKPDGRIWFARYDAGDVTNGEYPCDGETLPPEILAQLTERFGPCAAPPADARDAAPIVAAIPPALLAAADKLVAWLDMAQTNGWLGNWHEHYARLAREHIAEYRAAKTGSADADGGVEAFLSEVRAELIRAREKFPGDRIMTIALAEEFGELCKAVLDESAACVRKEAVQTAVMAARVVLDGDGSVRDWRREKNLDPLVADRAMGGES